MKRVIHWFRRDLRLTDNTSLLKASAAAEEVVPVYILSPWSGTHRWTGSNRQGFLCASLKSLDANLRTFGSRLILRRGDAVEELEKLKNETGAEAIFFNRDPDPHGRAVEDRLRKVFSSQGVAIEESQDICIHERDDVLNGSGLPFRVFTPYSKAWMKLEKPGFQGRPGRLKLGLEPGSLELPETSLWGLPPAAEGVLEAGEKAARHRMKDFVARGLGNYGNGRDFPAGGATSRLSQDLRFGLISIRELYARCVDAQSQLDARGRANASKYISELIWREFYIQILWHFPEVLELEFNPKFRGMRWPGKPAAFEKWRNAETGFPIVDAAMRELAQTGFMHNRTRMIAAMFLTKDLHLDWRLGEQWFMQELTDGEIASNNGGWQWSAGTGADAAPYFRIQNPWTQTKRYDPEGKYIRQWLPELRDVPVEKLSEPPPPGLRLARDYPPPMVDHSAARDITLDLFAAHQSA